MSDSPELIMADALENMDPDDFNLPGNCMRVSNAARMIRDMYEERQVLRRALLVKMSGEHEKGEDGILMATLRGQEMELEALRRYCQDVAQADLDRKNACDRADKRRIFATGEIHT